MGPLVTIGVPVYQGQDDLPFTLECVRAQTYRNLDVLISVDNADLVSVEAAKPFLSDPRFRLQVQSRRLGWAGNTDWTIRHRRGEFYIYQQHDDQVSPTYVADLVAGAARYPEASICFSEMQITGTQNLLWRVGSVVGDPITRVLRHLERLDGTPLRGLIRGSALDKTGGLPVNELESFGSEHRFLAELALAGEFRLVEGPTYYKRLHGNNLHSRILNWPEERRREAWAALAAVLIEVIVPAGHSLEERWALLYAVLDRFLVMRGSVSWLRGPKRWLYKSGNSALIWLRNIVDGLRQSGNLDAWINARTRHMFCALPDQASRVALLSAILENIRSAEKFDLCTWLETTWSEVERRTARQLALNFPNRRVG